MTKNIPVITIDGPGGSGKGTIAVYVARQLGWHCLESGVLYRALAYAMQTRGVSAQNLAETIKLAESLDIHFTLQKEELLQSIWMSGVDVTAILRAETIGSEASKISSIPEVRAALLQRQRDFRQAPGLVAEGRDMGTVVFPDAYFKLFLTASPEIRAKRRVMQLKAQGIHASLHDLTQEIRARDERDSSRAVSPLRPAEDAIILDTTILSLESVFEKVMNLIRSKS